MPCMTVAEV